MQARIGANDDDRTLTAFQHVPACGLEAMKCSGEVGPKDRVPFLTGKAKKQIAGRDARIAHHRIEVPIRNYHVLNHRFDLMGLANIGLQHDGLPAIFSNRGDCLFGFCLALMVMNTDVPSFSSEVSTQRSADSARPSGYENRAFPGSLI